MGLCLYMSPLFPFQIYFADSLYVTYCNKTRYFLPQFKKNVDNFLAHIYSHKITNFQDKLLISLNPKDTGVNNRIGKNKDIKGIHPPSMYVGKCQNL